MNLSLYMLTNVMLIRKKSVAANLHTYGVSLSTLEMVNDYLLNRKMRTKVGSSDSTWEETAAWKQSKYRVFSGLYFPVFGWNAEIYGVNVRIKSEYRKIRTRKISVFGYFLPIEPSLVFPEVQSKDHFYSTFDLFVFLESNYFTSYVVTTNLT